MRVPKTLAALLFAAVVAQAAPPVVTLPAEVTGEVSAFVVVKAKVEGDTKGVRYVALDSGLSIFPSDLLSDKNALVVVAGRPGRYKVLAYSGNADGPSEPAYTVLLIGTPDPPPGPAPKPDDKPKPGKVARLRTVVVSESSDLTARKSVFLGDKELGALYEAKKWDSPWWIDPGDKDPLTDKPPAKWKDYMDRQKGKGAQLYLVDRETGEVLYEGDPPKTPSDLITLIKKVAP